MNAPPLIMFRAIEERSNSLFHRHAWKGVTPTRWIYWNKREGWSTDRLSASYFSLEEAERYAEQAHTQLPPDAYFFRPVPTSPLHSRADCGIRDTMSDLEKQQ